jgi:hypothetical protein
MAAMRDFLDLAQDKARVCQEEAELWKADHEVATAFFDFQDLVTDLIKAFKIITLVDERYRAEVYSGKCEHSAETLAKTREAYRLLFPASAEAESVLPWAEGKFGQVGGAAELRRICSELRGMFTPDDEFFSGEPLVALRDEAIDAHRRGETTDLCETEG